MTPLTGMVRVPPVTLYGRSIDNQEPASGQKLSIIAGASICSRCRTPSSSMDAAARFSENQSAQPSAARTGVFANLADRTLFIGIFPFDFAARVGPLISRSAAGGIHHVLAVLVGTERQAQLVLHPLLASQLAVDGAVVFPEAAEFSFTGGQAVVDPQHGGLRFLELVDLAGGGADPFAGRVGVGVEALVPVGRVARQRLDLTFVQRLFQPQAEKAGGEPVGNHALLRLEAAFGASHLCPQVGVVGARVVFRQLRGADTQRCRGVAQRV